MAGHRERLDPRSDPAVAVAVAAVGAAFRSRARASTSSPPPSVVSAVSRRAGHAAIAIGMVRYRRELFFGCYADPDALPDIHRLPDLLAAELHALAAEPAPPADQPHQREQAARRRPG